jgi:hypothetical protein
MDLTDGGIKREQQQQSIGGGGDRPPTGSIVAGTKRPLSVSMNPLNSQKKSLQSW